jgi:hypothetical protein
VGLATDGVGFSTDAVGLVIDGVGLAGLVFQVAAIINMRHAPE